MQSTQLQVIEPALQPRFRLQDIDLAAPNPTEVTVAMEATSVNPIDVKRAQGYGMRVLRLKGAGKFPIALGNDIVGTVSAVGRNVTRFKIGDRVFGLKAASDSGTHATGVNAAAKFLRHVPASLSSSVSAAELAVLPYSFTTMMLALKGAGLNKETARGRSVLVTGAAGGLGQLALQVLSGWGAVVTAVCGTGNVVQCHALGASVVVDRLKTSVRDLQPRFDAVLNFAAWDDDEFLASRLQRGALGHATTVHPLLANFDRLGWVGGGLRTIQDKRRVAEVGKRASGGSRYAWTVFMPNEQALDVLSDGLEQGRFKLPIGLTAPLRDGARAFVHMSEGHPGRAALSCHGSGSATG